MAHQLLWSDSAAGVVHDQVAELLCGGCVGVCVTADGQTEFVAGPSSALVAHQPQDVLTDAALQLVTHAVVLLHTFVAPGERRR